MIETSLLGKHVLVTGASSGIGKEVVRHLSEQGAIVIMVARNEIKMRETAEELKRQSYVYPYDLTNIADIEKIFEFCTEHGLKLDGLVHSAGISDKVPIKAVKEKDMQLNMAVHYFSYVALGQCFINRRYSNNGGSIVAISSIASFLCEKGMSQYSASKAAVNAVTKTMAKEFSRRSIRVNAIAPAAVDTDMFEKSKNEIDNFEEELLKKQPLGIIPTKQVALLVEFILSDAAKYITGSIIPISGGMC